MKSYTIGLDYGSDSVRAVLVNTEDGQEIASHVHYYKRWSEGKYCHPAINQFRQHPLDHIEGLEATIIHVVRNSNVDPTLIKGICIDTTGSSPVPIDRNGVPLALLPEFAENPNAMMILWKDHTAVKEAEEINALAHGSLFPDYTKYVGGVYSSEWFWAKIMHIAIHDKQVAQAAYTWMEHCDLMTYLLVDDKDLKSFKRSRCAAGHKAMWNEEWGGLPPEDFLGTLHPYLASLRARLYDHTYTSDEIAGRLNPSWAEKLGLTTNTIITVGTFDAHSGAVGAQIKENTLVRVMGTSTCDIIVSDKAALGNTKVDGICGQVDGSVIPHLIGLEAGQSAFGDVLAWYKDVLMWPIKTIVPTMDFLSDQQKENIQEKTQNELLKTITLEAEKIPLGETIPIALDWVNGRRTPYADQTLKSAIAEISLGTKAPHIFKALVNAICFGAKMIVDRFEEDGVRIKRVIGIGGVARKSHFIMQTLANVLNMPIEIAASDQAPALGAAIYAAVGAGIYKNVEEASKIMGSRFEKEYLPQPETVKIYEEYFEAYNRLGTLVEQFKNIKTCSHTKN